MWELLQSADVPCLISYCLACRGELVRIYTEECLYCFTTANSGAAVTGLVWFFTYVPYMILRPRYSSLTQTNKIMLCLLSNTALGLGCQLTSMFEGVGSGIQWRLLFQGVSPDDRFTLAHVFGMLILDTVVFAILTWYIEAVWPGDYGVPQPWYFPVMVCNWYLMLFIRKTSF